MYFPLWNSEIDFSVSKTYIIKESLIIVEVIS